jgi:hypothetical protein
MTRPRASYQRDRSSVRGAVATSPNTNRVTVKARTPKRTVTKRNRADDTIAIGISMA